MSVLIKMEIPKNCGACPLRLAWCRERIYMVTRPERCPLISVPPHGRLIDADAFKKYISVSFAEIAPELENGYLWLAKRITEDLLRDIDEAPTIIQAEEGE